MQKSNNIIYRLRIDNDIIGYSKIIYNNTFYSKDLYGWSGNKIEGAIQKDRCTDLKDKNNQLIFEEDIVQIFHPTRGETLFIHFIYDEKLDNFMGVNFKTKEVEYHNLMLFEKQFDKSDISRISYAFLN
tara:strand:+ start:44 stop:430 length:387 start_codon:yes stop_codon:yes gene_type:complete